MKFILTKELGRLAKWLRILGLDAEYFNQGNPSSLIIQALREERVIITRNHRLPKARGIKILVITQGQLKSQLTEVLEKFSIRPNPELMFSRCTICNLELEHVDKRAIKEKVPEYVFNTQDEFFICPRCQRIYWSGTHWKNVENTLKEIGSL
ncbi:MAG: Mut7-C RNAse domain-containing protein [Candidatus Omnitrophica bacterium]|nr:Mut7-C RNAse domain-containing protein [Candidatus Omnitrophota bacterium]